MQKYSYLALKLDMSKVHDQVQWEFLQAMILKLGFDHKFVSLIMACVSLVYNNCIIGDDSTRSFKP